MKKGILILLIFLTGQTGFAQIDTIVTLNKALEQGNLMLNSFQKGDYDTFIDLTHPKIVSMSGGKEQLKEMLMNGLGPEVEIISTDLSLPNEMIVQDSICQCVFEQKQVMSINGQKIMTQGSLIGISYDSGKTWAFIGVASNTLADLQVHFPELSDKLPVHPQTDPILINE